MSRDKTLSDSTLTSKANVPLRTYSRHGRAIKRSSTSLAHSISSDDAAEPSLRGRKRTRNNASLGKTPTDMFWEHLSSSAPTFTHWQETDQSKPEAEQDAGTASVDKALHSMKTLTGVVGNHKHLGPETSLAQHSHVTSIEATKPKDLQQYEMKSEGSNNDEDFSQLGLLDDTAFTPALKPRIKRGTLLCFSSSPGPKPKKTRRFLDLDESLRVFEATPASFRPGPSTSDAQRKNGGSQEFRELKLTKEMRVKPSSDGFERDEARPSLLGKRRRIDSSEVNLGPLELTRQGVATPKLDGPTWIRGQKKPRVATTTSSWSRRQYFGASLFQIDSEEATDVVQVKQSKPAAMATQNRSKRRLSHIVSDDADEFMTLPTPRALTNEHDTHAAADIEGCRTSSAKHDNSCLYNSDADEPVDLLVFPVVDENEAALAMSPRTSILESGGGSDEEVGQLPPKRWMLKMWDYDEDTLALRPDSQEWMRKAS